MIIAYRSHHLTPAHGTLSTVDEAIRRFDFGHAGDRPPQSQPIMNGPGLVVRSHANLPSILAIRHAELRGSGHYSMPGGLSATQ
jgi:hypothetical protein